MLKERKQITEGKMKEKIWKEKKEKRKHKSVVRTCYWKEWNQNNIKKAARCVQYFCMHVRQICYNCCDSDMYYSR